MGTDTFQNFAYGSNMLNARLQAPERCPSARPLGVAELSGYELCWHKKSRDGSGKCDIVKSDRPGASVFGVLFEIACSEKANLDRAEGLGAGYDETQMQVLLGADRRTVNAYIATDTDKALKPYTWYRALVVAGAKEHGLPVGYVAGMEAAPAVVDPDQARHSKNMAFIGKVRT